MSDEATRALVRELLATSATPYDALKRFALELRAREQALDPEAWKTLALDFGAVARLIASTGSGEPGCAWDYRDAPKRNAGTVRMWIGGELRDVPA